jgi:DNA-directed RNA polymerase sigma subunit (sigma70/sigma32)
MEKKVEKKLKTIRIPVQQYEDLVKLKIHRNQPIYEVIEMLLGFFNAYKKEVEEEP